MSQRWPLTDATPRTAPSGGVVMDALSPGSAAHGADVMLIQRMAQKDQSALETFYRAHGPALQAVAFRLLEDHEEVRDVLQDCFAQLWERAGTYDPRLSSPLTWSVMIVRGRCLDRLRATRRRDARTERYRSEHAHGPHASHDGDAPLLFRDLAALVRAALAQLPPDERACVERAVFGEMTHAEVAESLDQPLGTIKSRLKRGLTKLRRLLYPHQNYD
jgi:RNA polymerase sigma-70 factor, ECF subfamily